VVGREVAVLLTARHPVPADIDGLQLLVVGESDWTDLRCPVGLDRRQAAEVGLLQERDFVRFEDHAATVKPQVRFTSTPRLLGGKMGPCPRDVTLTLRRPEPRWRRWRTGCVTRRARLRPENSWQPPCGSPPARCPRQHPARVSK